MAPTRGQGFQVHFLGSRQFSEEDPPGILFHNQREELFKDTRDKSLSFVFLFIGTWVLQEKE